MKRGIKLLLALCCVGLLLTAYLLLLLVPQAPPSTEEAKEILLSPNGDTVSSLTFDCKDEKVSLQRKDGFWYLAEDETFPVDQDIPKNMLAIVSPLYALRKVSEAPADPAVYGLGENEMNVTVTDDAKSYSFAIGAACQGREGYYVRLADSPTVYLADVSLGIAYLHPDRYALIQIDPLPNPKTDNVTRVALSFPRGEWVFQRVEEGQFPDHNTSWAVCQKETLLPGDGEKIQALVEKICQLKLLSCTDHALTDEKSQGLFSQGASITVEYQHKTKDQEGQETVTDLSYRLLLSLEEKETLTYLGRLTSSSQLCTLSREAVDAISSAATDELLAKTPTT